MRSFYAFYPFTRFAGRKFFEKIAMAYSESILTLTYDFMKYLIPVLSKYPRDQKFTLGDRIQNLAYEILNAAH